MYSKHLEATSDSRILKELAAASQNDGSDSAATTSAYPIRSPLEPGDDNPVISWVKYLLDYKVDMDTQGAFTNLLYHIKGLVNFATVHYVEAFSSLVLLSLAAVIYGVFFIYKKFPSHNCNKPGVKMDSPTKIFVVPQGKIFRIFLVVNFASLFLNLPFLLRRSITLKSMSPFYFSSVGKVFDEIAASGVVMMGDKHEMISEFPFKVTEFFSYISQMSEMSIPFLFIAPTLYSVYLVRSTVPNSVMKGFFSLFFFFSAIVAFIVSVKSAFPEKVSTYEELLPTNQVVLDSFFMANVCSLVLFMIFVLFLIAIFKFHYKPNSFLLFSTIYFLFLFQIKAGLILYYLFYFPIPIELAIVIDNLFPNTLLGIKSAHTP